MKRMWSPWRSQYIQSFRPGRNEKAKRASFRSALRSRDDRKNLIVWRGEHCFVIMNRFPYNSGHVMIVPNRQIADVQDLTGAELTEIMQTAMKTMKALDTLMHPQGYNFGANFGRAAGAGIDEHIHFHVVPAGMGTPTLCPCFPTRR